MRERLTHSEDRLQRGLHGRRCQHSGEELMERSCRVSSCQAIQQQVHGMHHCPATALWGVEHMKFMPAGVGG
jgi:hypothetical protein